MKSPIDYFGICTGFSSIVKVYILIQLLLLSVNVNRKGQHLLVNADMSESRAFMSGKVLRLAVFHVNII